MKKLVIILLIVPFLSVAQAITPPEIDSTVVKPTSNWEKSNAFGFDINETAFVNWNAGGINAVAGLVKLNVVLTYTKDRSKWNNEFVFRYGSNWQEGTGVRKTDDLIQLSSSYGYKTSEKSHWFYSAKFTFNTQANKGFKYPDVSKAVSDFLAPAYFVLGFGAEYAVKDKNFSAYISPLSSKTTLVKNRTLANEGAFGVDPAEYITINGTEVLIKNGKMSRTELGAFVNVSWKKEILKNIIMENRLALFSDYLNKFGNVDVNWELKLDLIVNKYVRANIFTHMIYDDDIKATKDVNGISVTVGPKVQLKQMLGVGFAYEF